MSVEFVTALGTLVGIFTTALFARRAKRAEVKAKELANARDNIGNAELMIDLVKKANAEAATIHQNIIKELKRENEKFKKTVNRLEKALQVVNRCPYSADCPVIVELQKCKLDDLTGGDK